MSKDAASGLGQISTGNLDPFGAVTAKEEQLQEVTMLSSCNKDDVCVKQEEDIGSPNLYLHPLDKQEKIKQEEVEIMDCHEPDNDELSQSLEEEHLEVTTMGLTTPGSSAEPDKLDTSTRANIESDSEVETSFRDRIQCIVDDDTDDSDVLYLSDDDPHVGTLLPEWSVSTAGMRSVTFVKNEQLMVPIPGEGTPLDYFRLLLDDVFLESIVKFTNSNAQEKQFITSKANPHSRMSRWKDLTFSELLNFLGLVLHTGTLRLDKIPDYWRTDNLFKIHAFRNVMGRDRFENILHCLYCKNPHDDASSTDKISFVVNYFNDKMAAVYYPGRELTLDDPVMFWRGRMYYRQLIRGKQDNCGIKLHTLTEHSGMILKFHVDAGPSDTTLGRKGHTEKVVLHLLKEKLNNGHSVFMDTIYNSSTLSSKLLIMNTYSTGILDPRSKDLPEDIKNAVLKKGETVARYSDNVMLGMWKDKRVVTYISTEYENKMVGFVTKRNTIVKKPLPVIQFNTYMNGVDRVDHLLSCYPCERKSLFWYQKIFIHVLQMILINAHNLHNKFQRKITFHNFRLKVISDLLPQLTAAPMPIESPVQKILGESVHTIARNERNERNKRPRKNCKSCRKNKRNRKTPFYCQTCPDKPGLCIGKCFEDYHNEQKSSVRK